MKTLMIVGAGAEQIPAYKLAKKRGLYIVGTDIDRNAPGVDFADHFLCVSTKDPEGSANAALKFNKIRKIDGVMTIANDVPYTVAMICKKLNLNSISLDSAKCASDKLLMKKNFQINNVECPWFSEVVSFDQLKEITNNRDFQNYVLKPIDGSGARGVLLIDKDTDLEWAYKESMSWSKSSKLIIEKFIGGLQLSTESYLLNNKCYTPAISERNYSRLNDFKPYIIEDGGTIPAPVNEDLHEKICDLIQRGAKAMGINQGIIKGDIVIDEFGHPYIIELAARLSGGWFSTHQIPIASGVNLVNVVISNALNEVINEQDLLPTKNLSTAIRYWFPKPGLIKSIQGIESIKSSPGFVKYGFFRDVGDIQPKVLMHPDRFGYVLFEGKDRKEAVSRAEQAIEALNIGVKEL